MNVRLNSTMTFTAGIHYNGRLQMNNYNAVLYIMTNTMDAEQSNVAFERIKYFLYGIMQDTVFINQELSDQCQLYTAAGIDITTLPTDPVDQIIGIMLFNKLQAIVEDRIVIGEIDISSSLGDNVVYCHDETENTPELDYPLWWTTADPVHNNIVERDTDKVVRVGQRHAWRDIDLAWPEVINQSPTVDPDDNPGKVMFADFKRTNDPK